MNFLKKMKIINLKVILVFILWFLGVCCVHACFTKNYKFSDIKSEIKTERLILSPTTEQDLSILSMYLLDSDVTKYLDPLLTEGFNTQEEAMNFLKRGSSEIKKAIEYTIKLKSDNTPIGKVDAMLYANSLVAFGYWLGKEFQGQGYANEACCSFCDKVFNASDIKIAYIACHCDNVNSIKLARKIFDHIAKGNEYYEGHVGEKMYEFALKKSNI